MKLSRAGPKSDPSIKVVKKWGLYPENVTEGNGGIDGGTLFIDPFEIIDSEGIH